MNKKSICFVLLYALALPLVAFTDGFKVVGYLPHYYFEVADQIDYSKLTHLNIAFANPDKKGQLDLSPQIIRPIVQKAHKAQVKVCLSLGGGALLPEWRSAWKYLLQPRNRGHFIHQLIEYVRQNDLQGIDVDLEGDPVDAHYSGFILQLRDSLDLYDMILTTAVPALRRYSNISDEALAVFDWINVMAYNLSGPWSAGNPRPHAPYSVIESALEFWQRQGVENRRLVLGLPLYGWNFSDASKVQSVTFGELVSLDKNNGFKDQAGAIYFNGIPTIKAKTRFALETAGGVMLWHLGQDAFNEYSLLKAVEEEIFEEIPNYEQAEESEVHLEISPNPFDAWVHIRSPENQSGQVEVRDILGKKRTKARARSTSVLSLNTAHWPKGVYVLRIISNDGVTVKKMIKR